jgi:hypothetical protein
MRKTIVGALCTLLFLFAYSSANASLIINEVDYDQPSYDHAEFIELLNSGPNLLSLDNYTISLINGASDTQYHSYDLSGYQIAANSFFVLCGDSDEVINCDFDANKASGLIQNGGSKPDAIALYSGETLIDSISYEGNLTGYVEGFGDQLNDSASDYFMGLSRIPDGLGLDSNNNNHDFQNSCITPGSANTLSTSNCTSHQVPEPNSLLLMLIGLTLLLTNIGLQIGSSLRTTLHYEQKQILQRKI